MFHGPFNALGFERDGCSDVCAVERGQFECFGLVCLCHVCGSFWFPVLIDRICIVCVYVQRVKHFPYLFSWFAWPLLFLFLLAILIFHALA